MSQPTAKKDAQEFMTDLTEKLDKSGYRAMAAYLRAEMPDSDVTSFGGGGSEKIATAIVTSVAEQVKADKGKK
jgi:hypothetical protein